MQIYFAQILTNLYINNDCDAFIVCGHFNARIRSLKDFSELDTVLNRSVIDKATNQHGQAFIEFLNELKMCFLNGRSDNTNSDFTCVSGRGKSVVDYICVPHDVLQQI